ncbi:transcriptional regulator PpsR [soil metagenome]
MKAFKAPKKFLADLDANTVATLIAAAADVTMIVDQTGVIRDMAFNSDEFAQGLEGPRKWLGHPWADTVTTESRNKVQKILSEVAAGAAPRWRHVNHVGPRGTSIIPVLYCAVGVGKQGFVIAFGRDLRSLSALQQQLVDAQQSMERDYSRLRHVETRYRLLFQISSEPVLIVDVTSMRIMEVNPAAGHLFGAIGKRLVGRPFLAAFDREGAQSVRLLLAGVRAAGRADSTRVRLEGSDNEVVVSASLFRQDNATLFLVRLAPTRGGALQPLAATAAMLVKLIESAPDGFVVTDTDGQILMANEAFLEMAQLTSSEQAISESIDRWLGRSGVDLSVLISNLRQRGAVSLFATTLRGEHGVASDVEISAVSVTADDKQYLGFAIRSVGQRVKSDAPAPQALPHSVEQLAALVGRVSLKELVREATDLIERLAIEAALQLTDDNRASAAEILGLSRQSLYVKLRRYGLATPTAETEARN